MDDLKSIRLELDYADENGIHSLKTQTIRVNKPISNQEKIYFGTRIPVTYKLSFTVQIPSHIHTYLIGKSVPSKNGDATKDYSEDYPKSINRESIEILTSAFGEIISDYIWLKQMESEDIQKVIYYNFKGNSNAVKTYWNSMYFGVKSELGYQYAVGYIKINDNREMRYNEQKLSISSRDNEFYGLKYVAWTEERELYFSNMQKTFESISENINTFESIVSEHTINDLISNSPLRITS